MAEKQQDHLLISVSSHNRDRTHIPLVNEHNDQAEEKKKKNHHYNIFIYIHIYNRYHRINKFFQEKRKDTNSIPQSCYQPVH